MTFSLKTGVKMTSTVITFSGQNDFGSLENVTGE